MGASCGLLPFRPKRSFRLPYARRRHLRVGCYVEVEGVGIDGDDQPQAKRQEQYAKVEISFRTADDPLLEIYVA